MVEKALQLVLEVCSDVVAGERLVPPLEYALGVASILANMHMDAAGVAAGLVFEAIDADLVTLEEVEDRVGSTTARVVGSMERFNILERKKQSVTAASAALSAQNLQTSAAKKVMTSATKVAAVPQVMGRSRASAKPCAASRLKRSARCLLPWRKIPASSR